MASAVTVEKLRQIIAESKGRIKCIQTKCREQHASYTPVNVPTLPPEAVMDSDTLLKCKQIRTRQDYTAEYLIDMDRRVTKSVRVDRRDLPGLLKKYGLPEEHFITLSDSHTVLRGKDITLEHKSNENPPYSVLSIRTRLGPGGLPHEFDILYSGILHEGYLHEFNTVSLSEQDGALKIAVIGALEPHYRVIIKCSPSLGYRIQECKTYRPDGSLFQEIVYDDYRMVNGIPYPFLYMEKNYDNEEKLQRESKSEVKSVKFPKQFAGAEFKLEIPAGTSVTDRAFSNRAYELHEDRLLGIDDFKPAEDTNQVRPLMRTHMHGVN